MRIYDFANHAAIFKGKEYSFVNNIRDRNTEAFEKLQKDKIELLLKYRDASAVVERYKGILNSEQDLDISLKSTLNKDLDQMLSYKSLLFDKLHEINLKILNEEEKNY